MGRRVTREVHEGQRQEHGWLAVERTSCGVKNRKRYCTVTCWCERCQGKRPPFPVSIDAFLRELTVSCGARKVANFKAYRRGTPNQPVNPANRRGNTMTEGQEKFHSAACSYMNKLRKGKLVAAQVPDIDKFTNHLAEFAAQPEAYAEYYSTRPGWAYQEDLATAKWAAAQAKKAQGSVSGAPSPASPPTSPPEASSPELNQKDLAAFQFKADLEPASEHEPKMLRSESYVIIQTSTPELAEATGIVAVASIRYGSGTGGIGQLHLIRERGQIRCRPPYIEVQAGNTKKSFPVLGGRLGAEAAGLALTAWQLIETKLGPAAPGRTYRICHHIGQVFDDTEDLSQSETPKAKPADVDDDQPTPGTAMTQ